MLPTIALPHIGPKSNMWGSRFSAMSRGSDPELLADQAVHLATVGAALRLAHHLPDDRADRLAVARPHALRRVGVRGDRGRDDRSELLAVADRAKALGLHDRDR